MTRPVQRNLAASVKARLAAQASAIEDVQHLLIRYALERLLYRLSHARAHTADVCARDCRGREV